MKINLSVTLSAAFCLASSLPAQTIDFEKQVQPILEHRCYACHGEEVQQSGLRLDKRQNAMRGGDYGPVIIVGKGAESRLIKRVINGDGGMQMPPTGALPKAEIDVLKAWIDQGAEFRTELKPEAPPKPVDPKVTALISAVRTGSTDDVAKMIASNPDAVKGKDAGGSTALHHAVGFAPLATVQLLLDKGAEVSAKNRRGSTPLHWSITDEAKARLLLERGAAVNAKQNDGRTALYQAASAANSLGILKLLLEKGADANLATSNGQTPLMAAAGRGDVESMRALIEKKAQVNAQNGAGVTPLMAAANSRNARAVDMLLGLGAEVNALTRKQESALANAATAGSEESVRLLLEHGAKVNVPDDRGYSPLMYAAASEAMPAGIVKLLLAKGADTKQTGEGETARSLASKRGDTEVARLLGVSEADRKAGGVAPAMAGAPVTAAVAVSRGLALLEKQSPVFVRTAGCNSCHAQDLPSSAAAVARDRGIAAPKMIVQIPEALNGESPERFMDLIAGSVGGMGWEMFDRALNHAPRDAYSDATVYYLRAMQSAEGVWKSPEGRRPPMNAGDMQTTALGVFALKNYAPVREKAETEQAIARARGWLAQAKAATNQDRAFRLLGLGWAGGEVEGAVKELVGAQHADGGWGQLPGMGSDAFASGQALYALHVAGKMPVTDAVYQKGVRFLLGSVGSEGAWHVKTRSIWIQPYFNSGFPYGEDQWISAAGTAWASMALSLTVDEPKVSLK